MHDDQILDGSDDTTAGSTQIQRRTGLKDTMKVALLILDGLDRSSINDLAKDQEYRDLVHRFLSPLTSLPLQDAVDQANQALKNGLDEISRGLARLFPVDKIPMFGTIRNAPSRAPIPASGPLPSQSQLDEISRGMPGLFPLDDIPIVSPTPSAPSRVPNPTSFLLPSRSQPAATTTTSPEPSLSPGLSVALGQRQGPPNPPPMTPLEQIKNDKRKMVTVHFLVGSKKWITPLKDVIYAINEAIWKRVDKREQRVLEGWMTTNHDIVLACQSPLDAHYTWIEHLDLSHFWEKDTVIHVRRGATNAYVARIDTDKLLFSMETLEWMLVGNANVVAQMKAQVKHQWGDVDFGTKLAPGIYLCSGSVDFLDTLAFPSLVNITLVCKPLFGIEQVYGTMIIGLRLSVDLDNIDYSST